MPEITLTAAVREKVKKQAKHTRWAGQVPGVYYTRGENSINIQVDAVNLNPLVFTSETNVIDLKLPDGVSRKAIIKDVQFDPVSDKPIHFDLQGLHENEKLTLEVPIVLTGGIPKGVRDGGMLQHMVHKLKISCLPKDIPSKIEIGVAELDINNFVHVRDLNLPNVAILENGDISLVGVLPPTLVKEAEAAPATEEAIKEPEVVAKGKKAEEGEEGAAAPGGKTDQKSEK
jgi:large subunit ribosomal protein L25